MQGGWKRIYRAGRNSDLVRAYRYRRELPASSRRQRQRGEV